MSTSPDDRFAKLVNGSASRGWVPEDDDELADLLPGNRPMPRRIILMIVAGAAVLGIIAAVIFAGLRSNTAAEASPEPVVEPATTAPAEITVHIAGAVAHPGVVTLPAGSRVTDAVAAVGGATSAAAPDAINLARTLEDGEQIHVPTKEEAQSAGAQGAGPPGGVQSGGSPPGAGQSPNAQSGAGESGAGGSGAGGSGAGGSGLVNINTADSAQLETLPGVGPATAAAILEYREQNGPFAAVEDLENVTGIGPATMAKLSPLITVS